MYLMGFQGWWGSGWCFPVPLILSGRVAASSSSGGVSGDSYKDSEAVRCLADARVAPAVLPYLLERRVWRLLLPNTRQGRGKPNRRTPGNRIVLDVGVAGGEGIIRFRQFLQPGGRISHSFPSASSAFWKRIENPPVLRQLRRVFSWGHHVDGRSAIPSPEATGRLAIHSWTSLSRQPTVFPTSRRGLGNWPCPISRYRVVWETPVRLRTSPAPDEALFPIHTLSRFRYTEPPSPGSVGGE